MPGKITTRKLRRGLVIPVTTSKASVVRVKLTYRGKKVAAGKATAAAPGTVKVKLSKVAKRRAARLHGKRLKLVVTGTARTMTAKVKVR